MSIANEFWLRSHAAQQSALHVANYNAAIMGTAALQVWQLGVTAPGAFWAAMSRVGAAKSAAPRPPAAAKPVKVKAKAEPKPAAPEPVKAAKAENAPESKPKPTAKAKAKAKPKVAANGKVAVKAEPVAPAALEPAPNPVLLDAPRKGKADDLTVLKGVGAKLEGVLNEFGIYHIDQIAGLNDEGITWLDENQQGFRMTATRYDLVAQAKAMVNA